MCSLVRFASFTNMVRNVDEQKDGGFVITHSGLEIETSDVYDLITLIDEETDELIRNPPINRQVIIRRRFTVNSFVHVGVSGSVAYASGGGIRFPFEKTFEMVNVNDVDSLYREILDWAENYSFVNSADSGRVEEVKIIFIPENGGGCNQRHKDTLMRHENEVFLNVRGEDGECFFRCIKQLIPGLKRVSSTTVLPYRVKMGLGFGEQVPVSTAIEHFPSIAIFDAASGTVHGLAESELMLMLLDGHYYLKKGQVFTRMCDHCKQVYVRRHVCRKEKFRQCVSCGLHHDDSERCNVARASYYQSMICGKQSTIFPPKKKAKCGDEGAVEEIEEADRRLFDSVIHYDIETYPEPGHSIHTPYAVGYAMDECSEVYFFCGDNCMERFADNVLFHAERVRKDNGALYVNAFNGSRFDHFMLVKVMIQKGVVFDDFKISNGAIVFARFKNIFLIDIAKHTLGSLRNNLKEFGCVIQKGDFDHSKASRWEDMSIRLREDCINYLRSDVQGLQHIYLILSKGIWEEYGFDMKHYISVGHLSYSIWMEKVREKFVIFKPSPMQEDHFRGSVYGGRCYKTRHEFKSTQYDDYFNGLVDFDGVDDYIVDLDVVSLYPTAMSNYAYPTGMCREVRDITQVETVLRTSGKFPFMGIYYVAFKPNVNLQHAILPVRVKGSLKWDLKAGQGWYTTVDIENAVKYGYSIELIRGWEWVRSDFIFKEYISELYKKKSGAQKGSVKYAVAKLFLNSIYGKMIQKPVYYDNVWAEKLDDFYSFYEGHRVTELEYIGDLLYIGGIPKRQLGKKISKPSHLGAFILSYSRRVMLEYIVKCNPYFEYYTPSIRIKHDFLYTDTDSLHVRATDACEQNGELGGITNDLGCNAKIIRAIYIAPKLYMLEYVTRDSMEPKYHYRGKGVDMKCLNPEVFEKMLAQGIISTHRDFSMKRIHTKRNRKQLEYPHFSIIHQDWDKTVRELNKIPWRGREFLPDGGSVPLK